MSRSTYISENLTQNHLDFIRFIDNKEMDVFSLKEIEKLTKGKVKYLN